MRNIYSELLESLNRGRRMALATIVAAQGSVPQVVGASALFTSRGLVSGTLGGGILEADAERKVRKALKLKRSLLYSLKLDAEAVSDEGALCGGRAMILVDGTLGRHRQTLAELTRSLEQRKSGVLVTRLVLQKDRPMRLVRQWVEGRASYEPRLIRSGSDLIFLEPVEPLPRLIIAGAGHVGQAVCHLGSLLGFEVTVIDDRREYANARRLPDADRILASDIGPTLARLPLGSDAYIVIVTRGHAKDAEALRACVRRPAAYIGMIGSKRKVRLTHEHFLKKRWATRRELGRVHAPIGLPIGSRAVQEIAVSIAAQLVLVRQSLVRRRRA